MHFAAESHVDRSIHASQVFTRTNVQGTHVLLDAALAAWKSSFAGRRFHHISTDEVFGSLGPDEAPFTELSRYDPKSPYAASKAASDFLVRSYAHTHGLPMTITNCSNNYGPYQFPEKLIPLDDRECPHRTEICRSTATAAISATGFMSKTTAPPLRWCCSRGALGETYNIGGGRQMRNIDLVGLLCDEIRPPVCRG